MNDKYDCLNPVSEVGLKNLDARYLRTENFAEMREGLKCCACRDRG